MVDREKVIKGLECLSSEEVCYGSDCPYYDFDCTQKIAQDALELLKEQDALLNKIYDNVSKWGLDSPCDDLVCDDGWCEEHCERDGTKPECIERWFKYLLKKGGEVDD